MSASSVAEMALAVAKELEDEDRWCVGHHALDAVGTSTFWDAEGASRWCASGHGRRLFDDSYIRLAAAYVRKFGQSITHDNDTLGREYVRGRLRELAGAKP